MRRFELVEGTSSKFWEITLDGTAFTVRFGRIGTQGQSQQKSFASADKARSEHDKLVAEKTKKGYGEVGAAAAPAPAAASAPKKKVAPAAKSAEPAKTAEPAKAPVRVAIAASIIATDPSTWPADFRDELHPCPAFPGPRITLDRDAIWKKMRERVTKSEMPRGKETEPGYARLDAKDAPATGASTAVEIAVATVLCGSPSPWKDMRGLVNGIELLVDHWVVTTGIAGALERLAAVHGIKSAGWQHYIRTTPYFRLASHAAHASQAERDAAREAALTLAKTLSGTDAVHVEQVSAFLYPEHGDADRLVRASASSPYQDGGQLPIAAITKLDTLHWLATHQSAGWLMMTGRSYRSTSTEPTAFGFVARFGEDALVPLVTILEKGGQSADIVRGIARAIGLISTPAAFDALASRSSDKHVLAALRELAILSPAAALGSLAHAASGRGASADVARTLLGQLMREPSKALEAAEAALSPALRTVVAELRNKSGASGEEASASELPAVLVRPPWLGKATHEREVVQVAAIDWPDAMKWRAGVQQDWASHRTSEYILRWANDPGQVQRSFGLTPAQLVRMQHGELVPRSELTGERYSLRGDILAVCALPVARGLISAYANERWWGEEGTFRKLAADHELAMLDVLVAYTRSHPVEGLQMLLPYASTTIAPIAAEALLRLKRAQQGARTWLLAHPIAATAGLVPRAIGALGADRDAAEHALRFLAREGHEPVVVETAARFGDAAAKAVRAVLDFDARNIFPARLPKRPDFAVPTALPRPVLRESGHTLPASVMEHVITMMMISRADAPYEGVLDLKAACTPASLAELSWELFQAWLVAGAVSKEGWAFTQLGVIGDDECARKLAALVRIWPGESAHARAVTGLDVLASIGTDVALMHLHGIAQKLKFKGLQEKAREKIDQIAEARGLTAEELADRLVPDLGLDDDGTMTLDFGPRQFRVAFDEALKPFVKDAGGARLPDLPKAKKDDDAEKAAAATAAWKALKKDGKTIASQQLTRLELAMCTRRRWTPDVFQRFLVTHPLLRHLVVRVVWAAFEGDAPPKLFRVAEDGTLADSFDATWTLPDSALVGVAHALETDAMEAARFGQTLADYEIMQPFKQLGRQTYALTSEEKKASIVARWPDREVPTGSVLGLENHGWRRGAAQDGGVIGWFEREVQLSGEKRVFITLDIEPGVIAGAATEWKTQKIHGVGLGHDWRWRKTANPDTLGALHPIIASEILRDVEMLFASGP